MSIIHTENKKQTSLVTGGTGLVGSHLLAQLVLQDKPLRAIYRTASGLNKVLHVFSYYFEDNKAYFDKIEWVKADVTDIPSLIEVFQNIDEVYHCAAVVSFRKKDIAMMRAVNIEGTANMINLALENKIKKFAFVSSIAGLGKNEQGKFIDETNDWNPEADNYAYAISKYGGEMEVWRGAQEGLNVVIVNPGIILGAGFWESNTGRFFTNAANSFAYYTTGKTGFVVVEDVVKALIELMNHNLFNERFILVSKNTSFQDIMTEIASAMQTQPPHRKVSPIMAEIAWRLAWISSLVTGKQPLITKHSSRAAQQMYEYNSEKIQQSIGFEFEPLSIGIQRIVGFYKKDKTKS
jgi:nucleoside-diphosphate-sugar epimerase